MHALTFYFTGVLQVFAGGFSHFEQISTYVHDKENVAPLIVVLVVCGD